MTFTTATATGGTDPVTVSCSPSSGTAFSIGTTTVGCTATDKLHATATCSFGVSVLASPTLRVKTILAFGDSLTAGEVPDNCEFVCRENTYPSESYPAVLAGMLNGRYVAQGATLLTAYTLSSPDTTDCGTDPPPPTTSGIVVINAGCNGLHASGNGAVQLLNNAINTYHPDLVLLLLGVNDGASAASAQAVQSLAASIIGRGVPVLVGTLPPEVEGEQSHGIVPAAAITAFNSQLQSLIPSTGAGLIDLYNDLATDEADWISRYDGLHLTAAGYTEMARVWFPAIQSRFEAAPRPILTSAPVIGFPQPLRSTGVRK